MECLSNELLVGQFIPRLRPSAPDDGARRWERRLQCERTRSPHGCHGVVVGEPRDAKVTHFDTELARDKHVVRLDISVDDWWLK